MKWYQIEEGTFTTKFGVIWLKPKIYPLWKYLLIIVEIIPKEKPKE